MIEFKIEITLVTQQTIGFSLFYEEGTGVELALPVKVFSDFTIGLGAHAWTKIKLSDEQLETLWGLDVNVFDGPDRYKAITIFLKYRDKLDKFVEKTK